MSADESPVEPDYECDYCWDTGEVQHPSYGSRECPAPTMPCPRCNGGTPQWVEPW